jgi:antirestriction protein ArdC
MSYKGRDGARADVYARITAEIVAAVERGAGECRAPWFHNGTSAARPTNVSSARRYRGINTVALWVAAMASAYTDGLWGTYRQWQAAGAQVRKGERATTVVFWKQVSPVESDDAAEDEGSHTRMFARAFSVFNIAQVEGYEAAPTAVLAESERLAHAEAFISNLGIKTVFGGSAACYRPSTDTIHLPTFERFRDAPSFYGVWLHEAGHGSGAKHRLDRDLSGRFGSAAYAAEECCVEILSGLVLADLGIAHHPRPDHAGYIASWLEVLKHDPRAIFTAASKAQQAADWMHAQQPEVNSAMPSILSLDLAKTDDPAGTALLLAS